MISTHLYFQSIFLIQYHWSETQIANMFNSNFLHHLPHILVTDRIIKRSPTTTLTLCLDTGEKEKKKDNEKKKTKNVRIYFLSFHLVEEI